MTQTELKIEFDENMNRFYIPIGAGWEIQTKGDGSTFRVGNVNEDKNYGLYGIDEHAMRILEMMAREVNAEQVRLTKRADMLPVLVEALESVIEIAKEAHKHWDADEDMKVGKILMALSGDLPNYRDDITSIHEALAAAKAEVGE